MGSDIKEPLVQSDDAPPVVSDSPLNGESKSSCVDSVNPLGIVDWFKTLKRVFGWRLLATLFFSQHILKGLIAGGGTGGWIGVQAMNYFYAQLNVKASSINIYVSAAATPYSLKSLMGIISDGVPFMHYNKRSYLFLVTALSMAAFALIVLIPSQTLGATLSTLCFFFIFWQVAMADLLTEAKYAEKIKEEPKHGPSLISFVWGGIFAASIVSAGTIGFFLENWEPRYIWLVSWPFAATILLPIAFNWLKEPRRKDCCAVDMKKVSANYELFLCSIVLGLCSLFLSICGIAIPESVQSKCDIMLGMAAFFAAVVLACFWAWTPRVIAKMTTFFFVQNCCTICVEGATFYFYTDDEVAYPDGPNFSCFFYTTVVCLVGTGCAVVGTVIYQKWMKDWHYWTIFTTMNIFFMLVNVLTACNFKRLNVEWGISDKFFVLGSSAMANVVAQFTWIPSIVLLSQLCPKGVEAMMYAVMAGAQNFGSNVATYIGAYFLSAFNVEPDGGACAATAINGTLFQCLVGSGSDGSYVEYPDGCDLSLDEWLEEACVCNESKQFERLFEISVIVAILPLLPILAIRWLIPDAYPSDRLLEDGSVDKSKTDDHDAGEEREGARVEDQGGSYQAVAGGPEVGKERAYV